MNESEIYCGNAKEVLLNSFQAESVDLIYMDPPFFSNRNYELVWGNGFELKAYEDRWQGGIENYIAWMEPVIMQCHRVLKPTGNMYLHCDWHGSAHLRLLLDKIFGEKNFLNDIIWCFRGGGVSDRYFARKHNTIYLYQKTNSTERTFNPQFVPYSAASTKLVSNRGGTSIDGKKRDLHRGAHMPDWLTEINSLQTWSPERQGYPTQKPEALLELLINAGSNPNDMVLDPMCGGGTTLAAAHKLHRRWNGIDVSPLACKKSETRLRMLGASPILTGMPMSTKALRALQPFMFQQWVVEKLYAHPSRTKVGDMGIDGYLFDGTPLQVKQSDGVGRNVVDNFETAVRRIKKSKGIMRRQPVQKTRTRSRSR
jgi:DNA modification methylase